MRKIGCLASDAQDLLIDPGVFPFSELESKIIRNITDKGFVIPYSLKNDSRDILLYTFGDLVSLSSVIGSISMYEWKELILKLFGRINIIADNGFLNVCNILLDPDYVLLDEEKNVHVIYIPVEGSYVFEDEKDFANGLRLFIRNTGEDVGFLDSAIKGILADASSDPARLEDAVKNYVPLQNNPNEEPAKKSGLLSGLFFKNSGAKSSDKKPDQPAVIHVQGGATEILEEGPIGIALVYSGDNGPLRFEVKAPGLLVGKQKESVDLVIPFSKAVSRVHGKVSFIDGDAFVEDMNSSNGTFINGARLEKDESVRIVPGDKIRFANVEFEVEAITR